MPVPLLNQSVGKPRLAPFKFVVQAVMLATDPVTGETVGEVVAEPETVYGIKALADYAAEFEDALNMMQAEEATNGGT